MTLARRSALALVVALVPCPAVAADPAPTELARQAQAGFRANCYRCHGQDGAVEGGFNYLLEPDQLVNRRKVVPGKPDESKVYLRMAKGQMPPPGEEPRPSPADLEAVKRWIAAGAPSPGATPSPRTILSSDDTLRLILADLEQFDRRARRFQRYLTLTHLAAAGLSEDELQTYRHAIAKLLNSLSWHPKLLKP